MPMKRTTVAAAAAAAMMMRRFTANVFGLACSCPYGPSSISA